MVEGIQYEFINTIPSFEDENCIRPDLKVECNAFCQKKCQKMRVFRKYSHDKHMSEVVQHSTRHMKSCIFLLQNEGVALLRSYVYRWISIIVGYSLKTRFFDVFWQKS